MKGTEPGASGGRTVSRREAGEERGQGESTGRTRVRMGVRRAGDTQGRRREWGTDAVPGLLVLASCSVVSDSLQPQGL